MEAKRWKKSTRTEGENNCVELPHTLDEIRDSKNRSVTLVVPQAAVVSLLRSLGH
ncbi:hypothetical protein JOF56_004126 [Kibdelosporangium banguiense]|uniref:DUF397 domain-containing protein n=1 Tax=Kibdelosporangium banguiense TaxID=1365924 RepID=A0ABS4TIT3_9PSEU|nr:hypothetical protein [Kibdelosporangium banguiense]